MSNQTNISIEPVFAGNDFKVLQVSGSDSDSMPAHYCTSDAFLFISKGRIIILLNGRDNDLSEGNVLTIPAKAMHSLQAVSAFVLYVVMEADALIEFSAGNSMAASRKL